MKNMMLNADHADHEINFYIHHQMKHHQRQPSSRLRYNPMHLTTIMPFIPDTPCQSPPRGCHNRRPEAPAPRPRLYHSVPQAKII